MERIRLINPDRIRWCSDDFGIGLDDLADKVHIQRDRLSAVLSGQDGLTFNQLQTMADFFGRGVLFFLETGTVNEGSIRSPQFRSISNEKPDLSPEVKRLIERAERHREVFLSLSEELDAEPLQKFEPPSVKPGDPAASAARVREWLELGTNPNEQRDFTAYRGALEAKGALVLRSMGYFGAWRFPKESAVIGFSLFYELCPLIVVRKQVAEPRQTFTLMHELAHLILHRKSSIVVETNLWARQGIEREANTFAGHLLVPDLFLDQVPRTPPPQVQDYEDWLRKQRTTWGVSTEVILRRLVDSGRFPNVQYEAYREWKIAQPPPQVEESGNRAYRHREPIHVFGQRYVRTVLDALNSDRITLHKASSFLDNLKIGDVRKLEGHIAGL